MADMKHTPGPWHINQDSHMEPALEVRAPHDGEAGFLPICGVWDYKTGEDMANAMLIAAAPDLLAAAHVALLALDAAVIDNPYDYAMACSALKNAIMKASLSW